MVQLTVYKNRDGMYKAIVYYTDPAQEFQNYQVPRQVRVETEEYKSFYIAAISGMQLVPEEVMVK